MPRQLRYTIPGVSQHIIQRGNNRCATFFSDEGRRFYLACLYDAARRHELAVHAYVLMTNHVHLLVTPSLSDSIPRALQAVGRRYVQFVNTTRRRTGTLWEGRHRASVVQTERYLAVCHAYIELNPVRAGMTKAPLDYAWSSCRHYAGVLHDPLVTDAPTFLASAATLDERRQQHRRLLTRGLGEEVLTTIRERSSRNGVLGDELYRERISGLLKRPLHSRGRGRPRRSLESDGYDGAAESPVGETDLFSSGN